MKIQIMLNFVWNVVPNLTIFAKNVMQLYAKQGRDDMVISAFRHIMQIFNSVDIDDESYGKVLFNKGPLKWTYGIFRHCYFVMGKESEYPHIALKNLEELLKDAKSQMLRAWYHNEIMILYFLLDDLKSTELHAREVVSSYEKMGCPDCMLGLHFAYMMCGEPDKAFEMIIKYPDTIYKEGLYSEEILIHHFARSAYLYDRLGYSEVFRESARHIQQNIPEILRKKGLSKLVIEPIELMELGQPQFADNFVQNPTDTGWEWVAAEDCSYVIEEHVLRVTATLKSDDEFPARLLREFSGDFILETVISNGIENEKSGAIICISPDGKEFVKLNIDSSRFWFADSFTLADNMINYCAYVSGFKIICMYPFNSEKVWLRLEWKNNRFSGYVSSDGKNWFSCGYIDANMSYSVKVGIVASSALETRRSSTRFEYFKIYKQ